MTYQDVKDVIGVIRQARNHSDGLERSREVSLAQTKLDEAIMWLEKLADSIVFED